MDTNETQKIVAEEQLEAQFEDCEGPLDKKTQIHKDINRLKIADNDDWDEIKEVVEVEVDDFCKASPEYL